MNIEAFLAAHGWADAARLAMTPDASSRSYIRLLRDGDSAILMQDPDGDVALFARLAEYLCGLGLSAPRILAMAPEAGLMLLEDLGDGLLHVSRRRGPGRSRRCTLRRGRRWRICIGPPPRQG